MRARNARLAIAATGLAGVVVIAGGLIAVRSWSSAPKCPPAANHPEWSVARRWDEALLDAIRRALPAPTVHARNLFHTSVAMWDAWAAYDPTAVGYVVTEKVSASDLAGARNEAISYAAYRVLTARYIKAVGADDSLSEFADVMDSLCFPLTVTSTDGGSPAAVGNRIAKAVLAYGLTDGSNEAGGYADPDYKPVNPPLVVNKPGTTMTDPNRWQPLQTGAHDLPERNPARERRSDGDRAAVGPCRVVRHSRRRHDGYAVRPGTATAPRRPGDRPGVQGPGG